MGQKGANDPWFFYSSMTLWLILGKYLLEQIWTKKVLQLFSVYDKHSSKSLDFS